MTEAGQDAVVQLTERQGRERDYHRDFASKHAQKIREPIGLDLLQPSQRRWWNSYWHLFGCVLGLDLRKKRVFVPGCGFGSDACRLAALGAEVYASDISPDLIEIARQRAAYSGFDAVRFDVLPAEDTRFPDHFFDVALFTGVFHHVDIEAALAELRRILKPGGILFGHEVYSHTSLQKIRESSVVDKIIYPAMNKIIYGGNSSYITEDEHKLNQRELASIFNNLCDIKLAYFNMLQGRLFPSGMARFARWDQRVLTAVGPLGRFLAGRVVFVGCLQANSRALV